MLKPSTRRSFLEVTAKATLMALGGCTAIRGPIKPPADTAPDELALAFPQEPDLAREAAENVIEYLGQPGTPEQREELIQILIDRFEPFLGTSSRHHPQFLNLAESKDIYLKDRLVRAVLRSHTYPLQDAQSHVRTIETLFQQNLNQDQFAHLEESVTSNKGDLDYLSLSLILSVGFKLPDVEHVEKELRIARKSLLNGALYPPSDDENMAYSDRNNYPNRGTVRYRFSHLTGPIMLP